MSIVYTAHVTSSGGREGKVTSDDQLLSLPLAKPGSKSATNPEQLFAAAYSACFTSAVEHTAKQKQQPIPGVTVQADVNLHQDSNGFSISVTLNVTLPNLDKNSARDIVQAAHQLCPYSKATRGNIQVTLKANGELLS